MTQGGLMFCLLRRIMIAATVVSLASYLVAPPAYAADAFASGVLAPARLARMCETGTGGPVDRVMAYAYYTQCPAATGRTAAARLLAAFDGPTRARALAAAAALRRPGGKRGPPWP